ncbi:MAG: MOSC domain-containing protein, partial [Acidimicrobiia bacterium]|nr:MOSC domain-containing protein [Acidimicrobiia bacterium]
WVGRELSIGDDVVIRISDNATRCVMTTLAQGELQRDRGVLQALATNNQQEFGGLGTSACLGVYAEVVTPGSVRRGDGVRAVG